MRLKNERIQKRETDEDDSQTIVLEIHRLYFAVSD